jgi:hypothetical protein
VRKLGLLVFSQRKLLELQALHWAGGDAGFLNK